MCPDSCSNLGLNARLGVGSPAALAQHMARIQLAQRDEFFLGRLGFACSSGKAERCRGKVGERWDGAAGSPRGAAGALLTPPRICSEADMFPQQAERLSDAAFRALKFWRKPQETGLF